MGDLAQVDLARAGRGAWKSKIVNFIDNPRPVC
jgi:hypothetical protein